MRMTLQKAVVVAVVVIAAFVLRCDALVPALFHKCAGSDDAMNYGEFSECMWGPFDDNKDGSISPEEFRSYLVFQRHISPLRIPHMFRQSDLIRDGEIKDNDLMIVFQHMDTDGDRLLSAREFEAHRERALAQSRP